MNLAGRNVLVSSAGRRVGLVRAFQDAVRPYGGRVITTDNSPELSAACQQADSAARVPPIDDPEYLEATQAIALEHEAGLVIPTLDPELAAFASVRDEWALKGVHVSVPAAELVTKCRNKRLTAQLFDSLGVQPLREVSDTFPRFIKPVSGSLSRDIHIIHGPEDLHPHMEDRDQFVHQELIDRDLYSEYTVDALYTTSGQLVCAVPRLRIEVRGGEISKGRTEKGPVLEMVRERLSSIAGARGCLCMQFFCSPDRGDLPIIGIEVNARFGGGYPMSHAAGADFALWLVEETFDGQTLDYTQDWEDRLTFLRFDDQMVVHA